MATVYVYEYKCPEDNDYIVDLYESKDDAYRFALSKILNRLVKIYGANNPDSDYHATYNRYISAVNDGEKGYAVSIYNDFVREYGTGKRQMFFDVYASSIIAPSNGPSQFATQKKKVRFDNGAECKKCNQHNEYASESNQEDGTYLCGTCKALGSVFS